MPRIKQNGLRVEIAGGEKSDQSSSVSSPSPPPKTRKEQRLKIARQTSCGVPAYKQTTTPISPGHSSSLQSKPTMFRQTSLPTGGSGANGTGGGWLSTMTKRQHSWGPSHKEDTSTLLVGMTSCGSKRTGYGRMPHGCGTSGNVCAYRSFSTVGRKNKRTK